MASYIKIKIRRGSTSDWALNNPVLELGEIAVDMDKHGIKVGNGTSRWSELPFCTPEIINDLTSGGTEAVLSAEQGKALKTLLDTKASTGELERLEQTLRQIIRDNDIDIVDRLDSTRQDAALSANMGRELNNKINTVSDRVDSGEGSSSVTVVDNLTSTSTTDALSANQGRVLNEKMSIFGMGYTVTNFNGYGKPTKITFEDNVTADLTWAGSRLDSIRASTGEVITINYNNNGLITGRTVTRS